MRLEPSARYWRDRAEEATTMAEAMRDPVARQLMLEAAAEYAERANKTEAKERGGDGWLIASEQRRQSR
jgi:hypothetical protein